MKVIHDLEEWLNLRAELPSAPGFVPTMGALHAGHFSLVHRSCQENDQTVVSIFVNPTQFDDPADLAHYPKTLESDLAGLESQGCDFVLVPDARQMYPLGYRYRVQELRDSQRLCGANRPGHFDGMLTVVLKLFQLVRPGRAYFGEKDYQQLQLVRGMVEDFFLPIQIVACPTVRDSDGVALSSRNQRLCPESRDKARRFASRLRSQHEPSLLRQLLEEDGLQVDYVEHWGDRQLAAIRVKSGDEDIRLIDNISLEG